MIVTREIGTDDLAKVYVAQTTKGVIEFAESVQPNVPREEKWVLIISCLVGCPARCLMCDAGQRYRGKLSKEEIFAQIDHLVDRRYPGAAPHGEGRRRVPVKKFKIQFTRMGEPAFNPAVLDVLEELPGRYVAPGLIPSVSTIGPANYAPFFERLRNIKNTLYREGRFQLQFSIHTTDVARRDRLIPVPKMTFGEIADYGREFYRAGDRKITLNFVVMEGYPIDTQVLRDHFNPDVFLVKLTPLNPTRSAGKNRLRTGLDPDDETSVSVLAGALRSRGFDTLVSIGEPGENVIGSNCGMYVSGEGLQ